MSRRVKIFVFLIFIAMTGWVWSIPEIQIRKEDVPLVIGQQARYEQNTDLFEWTPFDSMRTWWDLTVYPGGSYARIKLLHPSQGIPPAPDTFSNAEIVELDTLGNNSVVWSYLSDTTLYLYVQGIDFETGGYRFIGNYRPDYKCYFYPIYDGGGWNTSWTWTYYIGNWLPYTANETHQKMVVAKGKVRIPLSGNHFWPCLVIRDYMEFTDNFGTQDTRWIYEWVVPGRFGGANGVAAAQSTNGASQNFMIVENFLKMCDLYVPGWDTHGPEFSNTSIWPDTNYPGPYIIQSTITDSTGIGADSLFYNINGGQFIGSGHDSVDGNIYYYHIPAVAYGCTLGYFLWAEDSFCVANGIGLWHTDPICAPESTYYKFIVSSGIDENNGLKVVGERLELFIFPNVISDKATIQFTLFGKRKISLQLMDLTGRKVVSILDGVFESGRYHLYLNTSDLSPGIYFLILDNQKERMAEKLLIIK